VRSTVSLAHSPGMRLVAEGVEDEATAAELTTAGCDVLQGWHYARAMPPDQVDVWLATRPAATRPAATQPV
jgi:EAL domain-containing protein (putative c-di-GMP-specific phosphodiesterase class I)